MAQTGFTPIQLYSSSTATNVPLAANLATGELAINITDGKLFYKDNANAVQVIGWKVVPATAGGTGQTSYAVGDLLYADTTTTLAKLADVATGNALISGGVTTAPSWGKIGLTTHVSGTLPTANGGTNLTSFTANGVVYASSTSALATGSALLFDGTNMGIGVTPSSSTSNYRTLQIGGSARYSIFGQRDAGNCETFVGWNAYGGNNTTTVGTGYYYTNTGDLASLYTQTGAHIWWTAPSGTAGNAITFTQAMTLDASGNLLVGTTTAGAKFTLEYDGGVVVGQNINDSANTTNSTLMQFQIQGTQVGTIKRVAATSAVVYNTTSDVKLKENIADSDSVLEKIQNIKVRQFDWKAGNLHQDYGFIAQELNEVVSGVVTPAETENDMWQLDYSRLTPHLVKAIQEQQALITQLQADIAALKGS
jgi:hypothetical protein